MTLLQDYQRGIIQKNSYIRMSLVSPRWALGDTYEIQLPIPEASIAECLDVAANLMRSEFIEVSIPTFTVTWLEPQLLPSYSPDAVTKMQVGGRGYLYFALGADNQLKAKTQVVDPERILRFYGMTKPEMLAELSRLLAAKTCICDIGGLTVTWLSKSTPAATEFRNLTEAVSQLRKEIGSVAVIAAQKPTSPTPVPTTGTTVTTAGLQEAIAQLRTQIALAQAEENAADTTELNQAITNLQEGINSRNYVVNQTLTDTITQLQSQITSGDSAQNSALQTAITALQNQIATRQAAGDYVPTSTLRSTIASLQTVIDSKQVAGDYATTQAVMTAIGNLQNAINSKNYVMGDAFNLTIKTLQEAIAGKQAAGDYASTQALTTAITSLQQSIALKQTNFVINAADYGAKGDLVYRQLTHNTVAIVSGTDTTANIKAALDAAAALVPQDVNLPYEGAVRVVIPPGKYIIAGDKGLEVPSNVILDCAHAIFFNFLNNDWEPIIKGRRHAHATIVQVHGNKKSGVEWGDRNAGGVRCDSFIEAIRVQHCGVEYESTLSPSRQKCGVRLFGLWFSIDRIEVKEANIGLDIYQASDLLCPATFLMGCSTSCRMESAEQIVLPCVALDTNFNTGFQIDNSGNVFVNLTAFVNSDGWGTAMDTLLRIGQYSGVSCKNIYITAAATSIGGRMLSIANCMDSAFTLYASNARLFSQTSGNGQAKSHWNAADWTSASGQVNSGGLLAHNIGTNYQPYGNEGTPVAAIAYGANLSGYLKIDLLASTGIIPTEGTVFGLLTVNGQQQLEATVQASLVNGWTRFNTVYPTGGYYRTNQGEIQLVGLVKGTALNTTIFQLPEGLRPKITKLFTAWSGTTPAGTNQLAAVIVNPEGQVIPLSGNIACLSLENIRFRTT